MNDVEFMMQAKVVPLSSNEDDDLPPLPHLAPLSDVDRDFFMSVIENPQPPTESLKRALAAALKNQQRSDSL